MCNKYNVVHSTCLHSHERLRVCKDGLTCDELVDMDITVDHFCDICTLNPEIYSFQDIPSLSDDELSNLHEMEAQMKRAREITKRIGTRMPAGCAKPFQGRITRSDLECLKKIERVQHKMFCTIPVTLFLSGDLQLLIHDSIERAEVDFVEDADLDVSEEGLKSPWWMRHLRGAFGEYHPWPISDEYRY
jgi:hypothetical protein